MSLSKAILCLFLSLTGILIFPERSSGQGGFFEIVVYQSIDTSDYLPFYYENADSYNLMVAAEKGYSSEIQRLLKRGADINAETADGATPLIFAVANNKPEAVAELLTYEPDIDGFTAYNENALLIAVKNRFFGIAEQLIRAGANINVKDRFDATPLHYASVYGYAEMSDMLLYYDAEINSKTSDGSSPLLGAVWAGNVSIADLLLRNGAGIEEKDNEGFTPFLLAAYFGDTVIMDLLHDHGANIFAVTNKGYNALSLAIMSENEGGVGYLLKLEKNWTGLENSVTDPYTIATKYQRRDIIGELRKNNIPGKIKYRVDQVAFSLSSRFSNHDFYSGISVTFKEPYTNLGIIAGLDTKLWHTRVLMKVSDEVYYQYFDKGSVAYAGIFKDFTITSKPNSLSSDFTVSLLAGYSFGNQMKGTRIAPGNKFRVMPSASFRWTYANLTFNAGIDYVRTDFYRTGPLWVRFGVGYVYYLDNIRTKIKFPKWY